MTRSSVQCRRDCPLVWHHSRGGVSLSVWAAGVFPSVLLERARRRFEEAGGVVRERCPIRGVQVAPNGAALLVEGSDET
jgi:hypothetical protein